VVEAKILMICKTQFSSNLLQHTSPVSQR